MSQAKFIKDPLGNLIIVPPQFRGSTLEPNLYDIREVITSPAFIIQIGIKELYFFRLLNWGYNMMVEVKASENDLLINSCHVNPSIDFISSLLEKGKLISLQ